MPNVFSGVPARYIRGTFHPHAALTCVHLQSVTIVSHFVLIMPHSAAMVWRRRLANTPDFSFCHRYARGLKPTVGVLPSLRGSNINSVSTVGCVHAFGARFTHGWSPTAPYGA